jgi:hypothetical protein
MLLSTIAGTIRMLTPSPHGEVTMQATPFLNRTQTGGSFIGEAGLTGMAFHPDFTNVGSFGYGKLYTLTAMPAASGTADFTFTSGGSVNHQAVIREWDISSVVGDGNVNSLPAYTLANSRELMRVSRPGAFHGMFDMVFDDDGLLYITSGDGGQQFDQFNRSQNRSDVFGDILRIDPNPAAHALVRNSATTGQPAYSIPASNPFNGDDGVETKTSPTLAEIWALGVRSPYRLTMDRGDANGVGRGDMYLGDVGQNDYEEVTRLPAGVPGLNLGWSYREGFHPGYNLGSMPPGFTSTDPMLELVHDTGEGFTVVGGFVYRGSGIPELFGKYVFAELGQDTGSGGASPVPSARLYYSDLNAIDTFYLFDLSRSLETYLVEDSQGAQSMAKLPDRIISIGEDLDGELYLIAIGQDPRQGGGQDARVIRLYDAPLPGDLDGNEVINPADWALFKAGGDANFAQLDLNEAYLKGDLDGDFDRDLEDFVLFRDLYNDANGLGALEALESGVPEPSGLMLGLAVFAGVAGLRRRLALS